MWYYELVTVEKLSISMDAALAKVIRSAAAEEGVSVSTWLSNAAQARARQRALRHALRDYADEHGALSAKDVSALVEAARRRSIVTRARGKRA
jgi:hypothetical protein